MGVIFMPNHLIWKMRQCALILIRIMHFHTVNVYYGAVPTVHVLIFLTKKQIKNINKQQPQLGFTFITSLDLVPWLATTATFKNIATCPGFIGHYGGHSEVNGTGG